MLDHIKSSGSSAKVVNLFIGFMIFFIAGIGIGSAVLIFIEVLHNEPINPLIGTIIGGVLVSAVALISVVHNTQTINGTAAAAAARTAESLQPAIEQANATNATNAQTIQQMLIAVMDIQRISQKATIQQAIDAPLAAVAAEQRSVDASLLASQQKQSEIVNMRMITPSVEIPIEQAATEDIVTSKMEAVEPEMLKKQALERKEKKQK